VPLTIGPGSLLAGRYRILGDLGRGGAADVYRAEDERLGRTVAVKVFRADAGGLADAARHGSEMRLLARLNHPGLVAIYDAGLDAATSHASRPFLVMEYVAGRSLAERLGDGPMDEQQAIALTQQLADALAYIHGERIVHRDVKPANVLLDPSATMRSKLTDFGIARSLGDPKLTADGLTIGTAAYLSPEQALGSDLGPESDVYSLGLVVLECLTGVPAFAGSAIESAVARLHRDPVVPDGLEPGFASLLTAMTARQPQDRPSAADVSAIAAGLRAPAGNTAVVTGAVLPPESTALLPPVRAAGAKPAAAVRRPGLGRGPALVAGMVAAAAAVLIIALALLQHSGQGTGKPAVAPTTSTSSHSASQQPVPVKVTSTSATHSSSTARITAAPPAKPPKKGHPKKHG
jgi:serine/threonine protein kinase